MTLTKQCIRQTKTPCPCISMKCLQCRICNARAKSGWICVQQLKCCPCIKTTHRTLCQDFSWGENLWTTRWLYDSMILWYDQVHWSMPYRCGHDEADTQVIFPANFVVWVCHDKTPVIVIRSIDTDVFILMFHRARFWMDGYWGKFKEYTANDRYFWSSHHVVGTHMWFAQFPCTELLWLHSFVLEKGKVETIPHH